MAKFKLRQGVRKTAESEVCTVQQIQEKPDTETMYWIQHGTDSAACEWVKESELEAE